MKSSNSHKFILFNCTSTVNLFTSLQSRNQAYVHSHSDTCTQTADATGMVQMTTVTSALSEETRCLNTLTIHPVTILMWGLQVRK